MTQIEQTVTTITRQEQKGTACAFLLFSSLFLLAQFFHPHLFQVIMIRNGEQWIEHFRGEKLLHIGHLLEFICSFLLLIMGIHYRKILIHSSPVLSTAGLYMVFIGSFMLLGNKSALCLTLSGFETLSDQQLHQIIPALDVLLERWGFLGVLHLLPLLPLGFASIGAALFRSRMVPRWQSLCLILGSLLLANPEIEIINFFASIFLATGLIPYGFKLLHNTGIKE